jgi:hypothetical protein
MTEKKGRTELQPDPPQSWSQFKYRYCIIFLLYELLNLLLSRPETMTTILQPYWDSVTR